jgi:hypothetical protein
MSVPMRSPSGRARALHARLPGAREGVQAEGAQRAKPAKAAAPRRPARVRSEVHPAIVAGLEPGAVGAVITGSIGPIADGAAIVDVYAEEARVLPAGPSFEVAVAELEARKGSMTPEELTAARRELWSRYVAVTPRTTIERPRTEAVLKKLGERIESRMLVTAWDLAHPESFEPLEGHPGYKKISETEIKAMLLDAVKDIPLGEIPGGSAIARAVKALPNASGIDAEKMSFNELKDALTDAQKKWLEREVLSHFKGHELEAGIAALGAVTAIRAASPNAAELIDRYFPSVPIGTVREGPFTAGASVRYRDRRVLPDLDVSAELRGSHGPLTVHGGVTGTIAPERNPIVTGSFDAGARYGDDRRFVDLSGRTDGSTHSLSLTGALNDPDAGRNIRGDLSARFGKGAAIGTAPGRVSLELSAEEKLRLKGADGSVGFWGGVASDLDGRNTDARAGVMFRLRW